MPNIPNRYIELGRHLRALMQRERMNQPELARAADLSPSYPSKLLAGEVRPGMDVLRRIAVALNADLDELAHLAGYAATPNAERPELPGWELLGEDQRRLVRETVRVMANSNRGDGGGA